MIKLKSVEIHKYKSILTKQCIYIDKNLTTVVGMNESGKTVFLEALAKANYFMESDNAFQYNQLNDYPRSELKQYQKSGEDAPVLVCTFELSEQLLDQIRKDVGEKTFQAREFKFEVKYNNETTWVDFDVSLEEFIKYKMSQYNLRRKNEMEFMELKRLDHIHGLLLDTHDESCNAMVKDIVENIIEQSFDMDDKLKGYICKQYLAPNMPKFWYYDEYFALPSKINLNQLMAQQDAAPRDKTANALLELADIQPEQLMDSENFENFVSELESTSNEITSQLFKYWTTNKDVDVRFVIDQAGNEKILNIRIWNQKYKISLPLNSRSKGFNWFFSFIVWFSKIQADKKSNYVLLLDEPGLNLHAAAQADLLRFLKDLSEKYQIIYTTHSPFMIDTEHLEKVRTVVDTDQGSVISDAINENDPHTLFPLQAALGFEITKNLFPAENNLLVDSPADMVYLSVLSSILESDSRTGLREDITIVPVGGLNKVSAFMTLSKTTKSKLVCLFNSLNPLERKLEVDYLHNNGVIGARNIRFFDEFVQIQGNKVTMEDLFEKTEFLLIFNKVFTEYSNVSVNDLEANKPILEQICRSIKKDRFDRFRAANKFAQIGTDKSFFSKPTLDRFETMFKEINKMF